MEVGGGEAGVPCPVSLAVWPPHLNLVFFTRNGKPLPIGLVVREVLPAEAAQELASGEGSDARGP